MSDAPREARSFLSIEPGDLEQLAAIAVADVERLCRDGNVSRFYRDRLLLLCLCQGSALHLKQSRDGVPIELCRGISDFDVWAFFHREASRSIAYRGTRENWWEPTRFGPCERDPVQTGRKVDVCVRLVDREAGETPVDAVLSWLKQGSPKSSPGRIRVKPIFVISPGTDFGRMIWSGE